MKNTNLFKNAMYAAATTTVSGAMGYGLWKENQRQYEALKKANPDDEVVWAYVYRRNTSLPTFLYSSGGGGFEWTVKKKEPVPTSTPTTPGMNR